MTMDITSCDYIFLKLPGLSPDQLHALHLEVEAMNQTGFEVITSWEEKLKVKPKTTIISSELRDVDQPSGGYTVTLKVPVDTLEALERVADGRDMSVEALMKLYVGQGLRQDLARRFGDRLLESTASVLSRHLESEQEINAILREIQLETAQVE